MTSWQEDDSKIEERKRLKEAIKKVAPFPWIIDEDNYLRIVVKDNVGDVVYMENFDEYTSKEMRQRSRVIGYFLVSLNENYI